MDATETPKAPKELCEYTSSFNIDDRYAHIYIKNIGDIDVLDTQIKVIESLQEEKVACALEAATKTHTSNQCLRLRRRSDW